jgi:hypothetical protein
MGSPDQQPRIRARLGGPRRLQVQAQRANDLGGETTPFGQAASQLRLIHRLDRAEILNSVDMVQPQRDERDEQYDEPLEPHPS